VTYELFNTTQLKTLTLNEYQLTKSAAQSVMKTLLHDVIVDSFQVVAEVTKSATEM